MENELASMRRAKPQTVSMPQQQMMNSGVDESRVDALEKDIQNLNENLSNFNDEIVKEIKNHQDQINGKVDYGQVDELKDDLM